MHPEISGHLEQAINLVHPQELSMHSFVLSLAFVVLLAGCSTPDAQRRLHAAEEALDTHGPITSLFHSSLYYPAEQALQYDGYVVGIEKSPRDAISSPSDILVAAPAGVGMSDAQAKDKLNDGKLLYVSHIIESKASAAAQLGSWQANCAQYNLYEFQEKPQLIAKCPDAPVRKYAAKTAFASSWDALAGLREALKVKADRTRYSHLLVIVMGWNTPQDEAVRNFNSIVNSMAIAAPTGFRPLVIGVTWPSMWASAWIDPVFKAVSFPYKAADADELGLTWLGVLLHNTVQPARDNGLPVVVIGHSFGSRAASLAACAGPAIYQTQPLARKQLDHLINLQGAFLSRRLFSEDDKGLHFPERCPNIRNIILTASAYDTAIEAPFWGTYAGDERSFSRHCKGAERKLKCASVDATGALTDYPGNPASHILYVDASMLIRENAYGTGGGAHSDIYRKEHGALLHKLISQGDSAPHQAASK
jgi:hypothetical protein